MKKILTVLCALALVITCLWVFSVRSNAATVDSGTCGADLTWTLDDAGTLTISGTGPMLNYAESRIPWKSYRSNIKKVIVEPGTTSICSWAFQYCTNLISVDIPDGVTSIGGDAFSYCRKLTSINIPSSVTYIGFNAFVDCANLTAVCIQDLASWCALKFGNFIANPLNAAKNLYLNGDLVTNLVIPDGVTTIGELTFYGCTSITSVTFPASVTAVGAEAFSGCGNLDAVYIQDLVAWCALDFPDAFASPLLGSRLYLDGELTTDLVIPDGVVYIGQYAFAGADLNSVTIPASVTAIGNNAFSNCNGLSHVNVPATVMDMGKYIFAECRGLISASVESGTATIGYAMFYDCESLAAVTIPASVTTVDRFAFDGCTNLKDVYYDADSAKWNGIDLTSGNKPLADATIHFGHMHDYSLFPPVTVASTCSEKGYVEYVCIYGDTYRENLAQLPHNYTAGEMVEPTCTEDGYTSVACDQCGDVKMGDSIAALGHSYTGAEVVINPTCMEEGYTNVSCIRCDSIEKQDVIPASGHKLVVAPAINPTCTETGLTVGSYCERCQMVGVAQTVVPATGHSFADGICTVCGAPECAPGDLDGVEGVNEDDVIYLLQYLLMPDDFAVDQTVDYDKSGSVDEDDVIYLLQHLLMPDDFPLS